jgi:Tfp pilus assembly protein PilN
MRPANLMPVEERPQSGPGFRSAPVAYVIVGALLLAVGAAALMVTTDNQISSRKAELAEAHQQVARTETRSNELAAYTQFHQASEQRELTISNLAKSRFDWEKVMRQLALVLPPSIRVTSLTGTVRPDAAVGSGESVALRSAVAGPALTLVGCANGQEAVAGFITALKDIDGVTRVGVQSSESGQSSGESGSVSAAGGCGSLTQFQMVVAFDAAPIPTNIAGGEGAVAEEPAPESSEGEPSEAAPEGE